MISKYGILLKLVEETDAGFIINLRTNPKLNIHISHTNADLSDQIKWIQGYKMREMQGLEYYYVAQDLNGNKYGTIRIYDFDEKSFALGSWIFLPHSPLGMAAKAHLLGLEIGFNLFNAEYCKIRVRKKNIGVVRYIENFNAEIVLQDDIDYYFKLSRFNFYNHKRAMPNFVREQ